MRVAFATDEKTVTSDAVKEALTDRLRDEFVTQITHELRTPLTAIKGMSEVLLGQPEDRPPNRKFLEAIGRNAAILDRMIVELLDISEISAGSFAVRKQELALDVAFGLALAIGLERLRGRTRNVVHDVAALAIAALAAFAIVFGLWIAENPL